jgi:ATPase family protein associated with various cellular activities (AAA)
MKANVRFMNEVIRIVNGALRLDVDKVRNYTAFLADKLEEQGETSTAIRLRKLLAEADHQLRPNDVRFGGTLPVDAESRFPLIEKARVKELDEPPVALSPEQWDVVNEFVAVAKSYAQIDDADGAGSLSLLMYGPPGTGKSRVARHIARELGLDLYVARLDGLISSFLGSTSKNIRALFDFASRTPCVLFLDEFDAIAKLRGDSQELGELKRVVNSFIQNLDALGAHSVVIAATNHEELLDAAVWRRFGYRLSLGHPTPELRAQLWSDFMRPQELDKRDLELLVDLSEGFSGSDIREVSTRLRRRSAITGTKPELSDAFQVLQNVGIGEGAERRFLSSLRGFGNDELAKALRNRDPKLYSHSALAQLLGVSKATAYRHVKGDNRGRGTQD